MNPTPSKNIIKYRGLRTMIKNKKGMTLLELVLSIIIIAMCVLPLSVIYTQVLAKIYKSRVMTIASGLAEEKMDQATAKGYSGVVNESSTNFSSPFSSYSSQVVVNYVNAADLNTSVDPTVTEYKRVEVRVVHGEIGTAKMVSLLTNFSA